MNMFWSAMSDELERSDKAFAGWAKYYLEDPRDAVFEMVHDAKFDLDLRYMGDDLFKLAHQLFKQEVVPFYNPEKKEEAPSELT